MLIEPHVARQKIVLESLGRLKENADAGRLKMPIVAFDTGVHVLRVPLTRSDLSRDANRKRSVDERHVDGRLALGPAIVACQHLHVAGRAVEVGTARLEEYRAARGIAAEERALRAVQDFHRLEVIVETGARHLSRYLREVPHDAGSPSCAASRVQSGLALASEAEELLSAPVRVLGHVGRGSEELQVGERLHAVALEGVLVDGRDGYGDLLQRLASAARRDDDFFEPLPGARSCAARWSGLSRIGAFLPGARPDAEEDGEGCQDDCRDRPRPCASPGAAIADHALASHDAEWSL